MKKKPKVFQKETAAKEPKKGIVMAETDEDVILGGSTGDPDDFKEEVKKEAEKGKAWRVIMPIIVFLLLGGVVAYGTYYYQQQSKRVVPKKAEEKIQTPPAADGTEQLTETPSTSNASETPATAETPAASSATADYNTYVVKSGDTLSGIANSNDMTSTELAKYNNIKDAEALQIGQKLKIPK